MVVAFKSFKQERLSKDDIRILQLAVLLSAKNFIATNKASNTYLELLIAKLKRMEKN